MRMPKFLVASLAQLAEHALRKRMVVGSIPTGGYVFNSAQRMRRAGPRRICIHCSCSYKENVRHESKLILRGHCAGWRRAVPRLICMVLLETRHL